MSFAPRASCFAHAHNRHSFILTRVNIMQTRPFDSTEDLIVTALMALCGLLQLVVPAAGGGDPAALQAILGTLAAIGGGLAAGGIAGGFLSRPDAESPQADRLQRRASDMRSKIGSTKGFAQFRRLANQGRMGLDEFLMQQEAQGGSQRLAELAAARQAREAGDQALSQFGQFRLNRDRQLRSGANQLLTQGAQMQQQQRQARTQATMSLFNNIASLGGSIGGTATGQLGAQAMSGRGGASFGQMRTSGQRVSFGGSTIG